jgi:uncharacterized protein YndB with AHSA1/START domain
MRSTFSRACLERAAMKHDAGMKFRHEITYDATREQVFEMLADPEFRKASAEAMNVVSADVSINRHGDGMSVRIDQVQHTAGVPGFAKKIVGDTTQAIQIEEWSSPEGGTIEIQTPGKPTHVSGTLTLTESGGTTTETMDVEVKAKVPLIGGKLESLLADLIGKGMDKEHGAGVAWLERKSR